MSSNIPSFAYSTCETLVEAPGPSNQLSGTGRLQVFYHTFRLGDDVIDLMARTTWCIGK